MTRRATVGPVTRRKVAPTWKQSSLPERFIDCLRMLHIHGFLSDAEYARKVAAVKKNEAAGKYDDATA